MICLFFPYEDEIFFVFIQKSHFILTLKINYIPSSWNIYYSFDIIIYESNESDESDESDESNESNENLTLFNIILPLTQNGERLKYSKSYNVYRIKFFSDENNQIYTQKNLKLNGVNG